MGRGSQQEHGSVEVSRRGVEPNSPSELFHVAITSQVESIMEKGLNNIHAFEAPWGNADDWDDGTYLWGTLDLAIDYAHLLNMNVTIFRVDAAGLNVQPDLTGDSLVKGAFHIADTIPASRLELVEQITGHNEPIR